MKWSSVLSFAIGPIGTAILSLITLPITTWYFDQEDIGRIAMLQVAIGFSTLFFSLGLDQAYVREFHETGDRPALLIRALIPGLTLLCFFILILLELDGILSNILFEQRDNWLSLLIAICIVSAFVTRYLSLVLRMNERGYLYSISLLLPKLILLLLIAILIFFGFDTDLRSLVLVNTAALFLVVVLLIFNTRKELSSGLKAKSDFFHFSKMLYFGLPLILGGVAYWGLTSVDRLFLRLLADYSELGVYSVAVSFAGAATIVQSVFSTVWAPMVYKWASNGESLERINLVSRYILMLVIILFCGVGIFSWVVNLFLPENYSSVRWVLVSCLGAPLLYTLSETTVVGIGLTRRTIFSMMATFIAFLINVAGNWILIPRFGSAGAAFSTCVSFWVFLVLRTEFSIYVWKTIPRANLYCLSLIVVIASGVFTLFGESVFIYMLVFWISLLIFTLYHFKAEANDICRYIKLRL